MEKGGCVTFGDGSKKRVVGKGTISIPILPSLSNALFVDGLKVNLISISHLSDEGLSVLFSKIDCSILLLNGQTLLKGMRSNDNCYCLEARIVSNNVSKDEQAKVVKTACYIGNRVFLRPDTRQTSYELWRGRNPNINYFHTYVSYFHTFGSTFYILNDRDHLGKFDAKSNKGIFIGYTLNNRAYRVFNLKTQSIVKSSNVVIDDTRLKSNDHEEEVTIMDDSPLENIVEISSVEDT
ncbi:hypothetical protein LWI28_022706 [Acer negundo]|uniref:Retroviral polymerase SH3-like domain-containing protein n=1 Tax=Acer negundo TaxID=4023 RepID=A0AAD5P3P1_ACENE|nr:hypothetical protein LWI28_022706 [Acer negundo]